MTGIFRTSSPHLSDRGRPVQFTFDGQAVGGLAGETLAAALLAHGIHLVGRSFKYHRPRGIVAAGPEEPNALVTVDRGDGRVTPNLRATDVELYDGLRAISQNRWPSLDYDAGAVNDRLSALLSAGFYYKTFMWPPAFWAKVYEPLIRRAAGLGKAPTAPDPDRYLNRFAHCDVLIVGSGAAGLAAALAASESGTGRVILVEQSAQPGGGLLDEATATIDGQSAREWASAAVTTLRGCTNVRLLTRTTAFGYFADNFIGLLERVSDHLARPNHRLPRERMWQVRARQVVLATGAIERPLVFTDNDRPGIMLAGAARTYLNRYGVLPGRRVVVATADDTAYAAAIELKRAGVSIAAIADLRPGSSLGEAVCRGAIEAGISLMPGTAIIGTSGRKRVRSADLVAVDASDGKAVTIDCDAVLMSGGWTPAVHLFSQSRGKLAFDDARQAFVPDRAAQKQHSVGAANGTFALAECLAEGFAAGLAATASPGGSPPVTRRFAIGGAIDPGRGHLGAMPKAPSTRRGRAFVDFQNDVTTKDLELAAREGFRSIEHVKRYTTTGMATDQGKTSNLNALAIVARAVAKPIPEVGLTTFRMPYTPVTFGAFAGLNRGALFDPVRHTPMHAAAQAAGAVFEDVGTWKRARYFPRPSERMDSAVARECRTVREAGGIFDGSTLGKIEIAGPDAAEFLNRVTTASWTKLQPGRARYSLLLNEAGFIIDDGIVARLAPDRFHMTTTTGGAARVLHHLEDYIQTEFPELECWLTSITEQWAVIAVQGPKARDVIAPLVEGIDLTTTAMPHMSVREGRVAGVPARLMRVSFTGEMGYEINVPSDYGTAVWNAVAAAGAAHGVKPYGTEAMHVLRAEKGYIIVGQETDGTVTPNDAGLEWMIAKSKPDFVGMRSLTRPDMIRDDRRQLVGLLSEDGTAALEEGAQIVVDPAQPIPMTMIGHVTSAYASGTIGRPFALALVSGGRARIGSKLYIPMPDRTITVDVVEPVFVDKPGGRLHA